MFKAINVIEKEFFHCVSFTKVYGRVPKDTSTYFYLNDLFDSSVCLLV